jgi:hypothetical protein
MAPCRPQFKAGSIGVLLVSVAVDHDDDDDDDDDNNNNNNTLRKRRSMAKMAALSCRKMAEYCQYFQTVSKIT